MIIALAGHIVLTRHILIVALANLRERERFPPAIADVESAPSEGAPGRRAPEPWCAPDREHKG
jgi:hypothetical protein